MLKCFYYRLNELSVQYFYNKMGYPGFKKVFLFAEFSSKMPKFNLIHICPVSHWALLLNTLEYHKDAAIMSFHYSISHSTALTFTPDLSDVQCNRINFHHKIPQGIQYYWPFHPTQKSTFHFLSFPISSTDSHSNSLATPLLFFQWLLFLCGYFNICCFPFLLSFQRMHFSWVSPSPPMLQTTLSMLMTPKPWLPLLAVSWVADLL